MNGTLTCVAAAAAVQHESAVLGAGETAACSAALDSSNAAAAVPFEAKKGTNIDVPDYLVSTYSWAYLNPLTRVLFDQSAVVSAILWGNANRLIRAVLNELEPGQKVLQTACVYGDFSTKLASHIGPLGSLDVVDIAPIQVMHCRRKLERFPYVTVRQANAVDPGGGPYDAICCFFLLHEVPHEYKSRIVNALLARVRPGGKVIFVDYHQPDLMHPLRGIMSIVFSFLEPFARELWAHEIASYAHDVRGFDWSKETWFGGLYQRVIARRHLTNQIK
jgi:ubiquinone/menaquinone biosynthesis C-methylase UbiE